MKRTALNFVSTAFMVSALASVARVAHAEDGGNDVCPAASAEAEDVRDRYDASERLVHQLRLRQSRVVQETAIVWHDSHAVARTEVTPGHLRIARTNWHDDHVTSAECYLDGARVAEASYRYEGDRLVSVEKHFAERNESIRFSYDADGRLISTEVRNTDGVLVNVTHAERVPPHVPVRLNLSAGGSYQSDTELYDANAGIGIYRRPLVQRFGADPLEVRFDALFKFHRAAGVTSTDQTSERLSVDYHDILPKLTLFTFTSLDRNLPANLRLNLEEAVLGVKFEIVPRARYQVDVSFAPVWNFRSIIAPKADGTSTDENTSKLRGSLRARAGVHRQSWSLLNTFEWLPTLFGDDVSAESTFWNRSVLRDTITLDMDLSQHLSLHQDLQYTRDRAMRAQATCPDSANPLCRGYAVSSSTSVVLKLDI